MVSSDEKDDQLYRKHTDLCNKLNLEPDTVSTAWNTFQSITKNFVLEGDPLHWLGCSVYVATRVIETPTLDSTAVVKGNCINLTSLLRHSNLSFAQFFSKINNWAKMAHLSEDFCNKISHLGATFSVSFNTFKEYHPLFVKIFLAPNSQDLDQAKHRNRKIRPIHCTTSKIFEFIWNLFITLKGEDLQYSTDIVKSYHLLYACVDLAFKNAFLADRRDLLNPNFEGLPPDWTNPGFEMPSEAPCLIGLFCKCKSMLTDAMHTKIYVCKNLITKLIKNKTLIADESNFTGLFEADNFDYNFKNITRTYESQLLNKGDLDERIFLAECRRQLLEREQASNWNVKAFEPDTSALDSPRNSFGTVTPRGCDTPLTGRGFLGPREADISPLSIDKTATQKITRLHNMVNNRAPAPSETLIRLFHSCETDPIGRIQGIINVLGKKFISAYTENNLQLEDEANNRLKIGITLFYKFIENILMHEKSIHKNISALVEKDLFYQCMFTCCLEIVIFSYNYAKKFPWIVDALEIEPIHFVKVIELIVRTKDHLSREMIKHLNRIEETIIESLVWRTSSQIWDAIATSDQDIPKFEDTALPGHLLYSSHENTSRTNSESSPSSQSPGPSATDCFQSPIGGQNINRNLFPSGIQGGQSLLHKHTHLMITDKDGNRKLIPIVETERQNEQPQNIEPLAPAVPRRTGSLSIIFRKFYNLAGVRMEHLCTKLQITDFELRRKIWTVFEDSVRLTELIKDRHLDQLLMCAIYVICKVCGNSFLFSDIMKFYREQPQAASPVYRDVLIERERVEEDGTVVTERRGDLIHFYNSKYVDVMQKYAVRFQNNYRHSNADILLSPLPAAQRNLVSPRIQIVDNVFVKPFESPNTNLGSSFNYFFSRSPSKDLKYINKAINNNGVTGKRLLIEDDSEMPSSKQRISNRKIQSLVAERRSQNSE